MRGGERTEELFFCSLQGTKRSQVFGGPVVQRKGKTDWVLRHQKSVIEDVGSANTHAPVLGLGFSEGCIRNEYIRREPRGGRCVCVCVHLWV